LRANCYDGVMQEMLAVTMMLGTAKRQLNGELDVESAPGKGTTIRVVIPFR
jgi:signal transduction histidine kinase